jgi:putative aldouronate transport system substrate-binding protein
MMSIPQGAKNPERALMLLDKLQNDKEYFDLTTYGVPGFTYNLTSDGKLDYSKIDTKTITFDISPWAWRNSKLMRTSTTDWSKYSKIVDTLASKSKIDPLDGFSFDVTNVQTDIAAVTQVQEQYAKPFETGILAGSVDESYKTLIEKLKGAGIEKIKADVDKQLKAFQASKKK